MIDRMQDQSQTLQGAHEALCMSKTTLVALAGNIFQKFALYKNHAGPNRQRAPRHESRRNAWPTPDDQANSRPGKHSWQVFLGCFDSAWFFWSMFFFVTLKDIEQIVQLTSALAVA